MKLKRYSLIIFCLLIAGKLFAQTITSKNSKLNQSINTTSTINCITTQPGGATIGSDAFVWDYQPNSNFGSSEALDVTAWTASGTPYISRVLIQFDLSFIPPGSIIDTAFLSLYHNNTTTNYNGVHSGLNDSFLQRVISSWQENSVTWNNQPSTTMLNQISLPAATSGTQDFLNIDVKNLVIDMINNPSSSFGFMMKLQTEQTYRDLIFASSEHANALIHPKLVVCYTVLSAIQDLNSNETQISFSPNPMNDVGTLLIDASTTKLHSVFIVDRLGKLILERRNTLEKEIKFDGRNLTSGIYFVEVTDANGVIQSLKFVVE